MWYYFCLFFFNQKTAYELRISDWSSDVCSSDLALYVHRKTGEYLVDKSVNSRIIEAFKGAGAYAWFGADHQALLGPDYDLNDYEVVNDILDEIGRASCRERVCQYV